MWVTHIAKIVIQTKYQVKYEFLKTDADLYYSIEKEIFGFQIYLL